MSKKRSMSYIAMAHAIGMIGLPNPDFISEEQIRRYRERHPKKTSEDLERISKAEQKRKRRAARRLKEQSIS